MMEAAPIAIRRYLPYLPTFVNAIIVVMIGLTAARLFWLLWPQADLPATAGPAVHRQGPAAAPVDMDVIAAAHLFGEKAAGGFAASGGPEIRAPETRLDLTLTGIVSSYSGERSWALIRSGRGEQKPYAVGDTVAGGVKLHAIYANRVILDRNGRYETLTLEYEKGSAGVQRAPRDERVAGDAAQRLSAIRREVLNDPSKISQYIRLQPARREGNLIGYRIYPAGARDLFGELGLKRGELVTAVNGVELDDASGNMEVLRTLSQAASVSVTLESGGERRTMTVNFE